MSMISDKQFDEALGFLSFAHEIHVEGRLPKKRENVVDWNYNKDPEIIQREKERVERSNLQSKHGDTAEFYDQVIFKT